LSKTTIPFEQHRRQATGLYKSSAFAQMPTFHIEVLPEIWSTFDESITDGFGSLVGFLKGGCTHEEVLQWTTGRGEIKTG
jgi:hypothetical protein